MRLALPAAVFPSVVPAWSVTVLLAVPPAWCASVPREDAVIAVIGAVTPAFFTVVSVALLRPMGAVGGLGGVVILRGFGAAVVFSAVAGARLAHKIARAVLPAGIGRLPSRPLLGSRLSTLEVGPCVRNGQWGLTFLPATNRGAGW